MSLLIIPAVIALLIKIAVLFASGSSKKQQVVTESAPAHGGSSETEGLRKPALLGVFTTMILIMSGHNLAEVLFYIEFDNGTIKESLLRWYYLLTILSLAMMVIYAKSVSRIHDASSSMGSLVTGFTVAIALALGGLAMFTDLLISGAYSIGYSMTAVRADGYWLFFAFSLLSFIAIFSYLISGYINARSHQAEIQCGYTLLALLPIILTSLCLIVIMKLGFAVNAALVMPFATAAFLVITLKGERVHQMFDIRRHIPLSLERRTSAQIMEIFSAYAQDSSSYRDALNDIERLLVLHKHEKHGGNVSTTAASMEMPRSSLYSIFRRLDIDLNEMKEDSKR